MKKVKKVFLLILVLFISVTSAQTDFERKSISGKNIKLSDHYEKGPVILSFWALWCQPCRSELVKINNLYSKYSPEGLSVISVNIDSPRSIAKVKSYIVSHKIKFPVIKDPQKKLLQEFNGLSIPYLLVINKKGEIVNRHIGYVPGDEIKLEEEIKSLLGGS